MLHRAKNASLINLFWSHGYSTHKSYNRYPRIPRGALTPQEMGACRLKVEGNISDAVSAPAAGCSRQRTLPCPFTQQASRSYSLGSASCSTSHIIFVQPVGALRAPHHLSRRSHCMSSCMFSSYELHSGFKGLRGAILHGRHHIDDHHACTGRCALCHFISLRHL